MIGRRVLVTGASRGIGLAIAMRFLADGAKVLMHERRDGMGDLEKEADRAALFERARDELGGLDVLVNNAGAQSFGALGELSNEEIERMLRVNVVAALDCMHRAATLMRASSGDRCIVNVASIRASRPGSGAAVYAATKAALVAATRSAAIEYGPAGIRVNAVSPGLIWRDGLDREWPDGVRNYEAQAPLRRIGQADDVAAACAMLASADAGWITGVDLVVDGGISLVR